MVSAGAGPARPHGQADGELDMPKLLMSGSGIYTGLTALLFPLSVMKTRLQACTKPTSLRQEAQAIYTSAGLGGFFRGLGPVLLGAVPARAAYIATLESSKPLSYQAAEAAGIKGAAAAALCNGTAGFSAVLASQLIYVPVRSPWAPEPGAYNCTHTCGLRRICTFRCEVG